MPSIVQSEAHRLAFGLPRCSRLISQVHAEYEKQWRQVSLLRYRYPYSKKPYLLKLILSGDILFFCLVAVLRIRDMLVRIRIRGSVPLTKDPDPAIFVSDLSAIFVSDLQDGNKKIIFCLLLFEVIFTLFSKIKSHKEVTKQWDPTFFLLFLIDDRRIRIREAQKHRH
jgi:hypothetical protein